MSSISAIASSVISMNQSKLQEQMSMTVIKLNAQAEQAVADMLMKNARQIEELSRNASGGRIDIYI